MPKEAESLINKVKRVFTGKSVPNESIIPTEEALVPVEWMGISYMVKAEARQRFEEYSPKAPICTSCGAIILPGLVGKTDKGLAHLSSDCCDSQGRYSGRIDNEGRFIPAFPEGRSAIEECLKTRETVIVNLDPADQQKPHL